MAKSELPKGWEWKRLGEACQINPRKTGLENYDDETKVTFVPMPAVDEDKGVVAAPEIGHLGEVKKGYTFFRENDVIFAKITPCMQNGKSAIARNLVNGLGFGSTEFHVLRPQNNVLSEWIYFLVRQKWFRDLAAAHFTGSVGQQRVPAEFLEKQEIPLPPLEEQRRIVARIEELLSRIGQAKSLRQKSLTETSAIIPSALQEVFSRAEYQGWEAGRLSEVAPVVTETIQPNNWPERMFNYISLEHIESHTGRLNGFKPIKGKEIKSSKVRFTTKHVLYGKLRPYLNKVFVPDFEGAATSEMLTLLPNPKLLERGFLAWYLRSPKFVAFASSNITGSRMPRVSMYEFKNAEIWFPAIDEQRRIVVYLDHLQEKVNELKHLQSETEKEIEQITQSTLSKAFRGELVV